MHFLLYLYLKKGFALLQAINSLNEISENNHIRLISFRKHSRSSMKILLLIKILNLPLVFAAYTNALEYNFGDWIGIPVVCFLQKRKINYNMNMDKNDWSLARERKERKITQIPSKSSRRIDSPKPQMGNRCLFYLEQVADGNSASGCMLPSLGSECLAQSSALQL